MHNPTLPYSRDLNLIRRHTTIPYVKKEAREAIAQYVGNVRTYGDLNYLISKALLQTFQAVPRYETIHILRRDFVVYPKDNPLLNKLRADFSDRFTVSDVYAAAQEAFQEFRDRVGRLYEAGKCLEEGDLPEYEEIIAPLLQKIGELRKKKEASRLVLPNEAH